MNDMYIGRRVLLIPHWTLPPNRRAQQILPPPQSGRVIYVNYRHLYCVVQYDRTGLKEAFKLGSEHDIV